MPLTLAIIPSLVVSVNGERFAIPQISVVELLRIRADKIKERVKVIGEAEVLPLRDELIPIVRFADVLGIERRYTDPESGEEPRGPAERWPIVAPARRDRTPIRETSLGRRRAGERTPGDRSAATGGQ